MTSDKLNKARERAKSREWMNGQPSSWVIAVLAKDIDRLLAHVEEQQKELGFLRAVVRDLTEESDAAKEVVRMQGEIKQLKKVLNGMIVQRCEELAGVAE